MLVWEGTFVNLVVEVRDIGDFLGGRWLAVPLWSWC
jgi:hypothetical protein